MPEDKPTDMPLSEPRTLVPANLLQIRESFPDHQDLATLLAERFYFFYRSLQDPYSKGTNIFRYRTGSDPTKRGFDSSTRFIDLLVPGDEDNHNPLAFSDIGKNVALRLGLSTRQKKPGEPYPVIKIAVWGEVAEQKAKSVSDSFHVLKDTRGERTRSILEIHPQKKEVAEVSSQISSALSQVEENVFMTLDRS